ncbi:MAG: hypothetical protein ABS76_07790 [Pelagibacterium sp. SCN 64-44]|nr:MAG: hypothetical protein ABS76_07790 [Pelagibacterium sp. SCN 64-44]
MWGQIDGVPKLEIARQTLTTVLSDLPNDLELGLMAYGHREKGNCGDIELIVPPAAGTATAISQAAGTMRFLGKTPLSAAVQMAAEELRYTEDAATVILITDGVETCEADPCALASALESAGVGFTAHVIGFGLSGEEGAQVACIAENTGGRYLPANNAEALADALTAAIGDDLATDVVPAMPAPSRHFPGAELMPNVALAPTGYNVGEPLPHPQEQSFPADGTIAQCQAMCTADSDCGAWRYEPKGSNFVDHARCFVYSPSTEFDLAFYPEGEGWASGIKDGVVVLTSPYTPQEPLPEASLDAPETVPAGQKLTISWTGPAAPLDTIEIGLPGDGERWAYTYVAEGEPAALLMPGETGDYELRYKFRDQFVIATRLVTIIEAETSMTAPDQVLAGSEISIGWVGPDADYDNIQLAELGSDSYLSYAYVRDNNPVVMTMPDVPGLYELRYKLADTEVVATRPIEILPADAVLPENPAASSPVPVILAADMGEMVFSVVWSATPVPGQNLPPEAWALSEGTADPVNADFLPGEYDVLGDAGDQVFVGRIKVVAGAENHFVIPYSAEFSPAGEDQAGGHGCARTEPCRIEDATGLSFMLPAGWRTDEVFIAETAGGVRAPYPSVTFISADGSAVITLNPLRWLESNGTCSASAVGELCIHGQPSGEALLAYSIILPSLTYRSQEAWIPDFGGQSFIAPDGDKAMAVLVPGWGG